ncbi:putative tRNA pseudouridine13 synthase [Cocos nucifera]|uniref:Putative tRNA pseudouridine13 synthase n=1 Tax=Cocos nucifera TaxID=13894 RepID=A0A8K0IDV4_COCNU|nr:putative tRNA pseudouridine13 synthase [Cocos nucifera]
MAKSLDEPDVGISCYVSSLSGFRGVLKQRYSDFIVNEVDLDEKIVHLSSFDLPPDCTEVKEEENPPMSGKDYFCAVESFRSLCGDHDAEALKGLLENISSSAEGDIAPVVLSPDSDKSHRAEVHNFFKKNFKFLVTDTVEGSEGASKCVRVRFCSVQGGGGSRRGKKRKDIRASDLKDDMPFDSRGSDNWPENLGKFLRFHLYKENKDTQEALGVIGKMLGVQVTVFKQHAKRLAALNSRLFGIKVGDFCYVREGLVLGQLFGNRFTITLRGVVADSEDSIKEAADGLGRNGFINYYGLQRFGSGSVPTQLIGAALLRGEWKSAANLILDPREGDILKIYSFFLPPSPMLLGYSYTQVSLSLAYNLLCNLVTSFGSLLLPTSMCIVTKVTCGTMQLAGGSKRISQVILGDLVFCKESSAREVAALDISEPEDDCNDLYNCQPATSEEAVPEEKVQSVKTVDSEDLLNGIYTFEDVVLPLPGSRILYPANDIADVYHDMAKKVTVFKQHAKRLAALNSRLFGIKVGDFCYVREGLVLGQLFGNRFTITLRGVVADSEDSIKEAADGLGRNGFINYYGLQRFGSGSVPTQLIGAALLRGEWKSAANLILDPREGDILKIYSFFLPPSPMLLGYSYTQVSLSLAYNLLCNLVTSFGSLLLPTSMCIVTKVTCGTMQLAGGSKRISQVILGDLVFCKESSAREVAALDISEPEDDCNDLYNCQPATSEEAVPEEKVQSVKTVDSEDLLNGIYTFEDVVLPLPGSRILYPANDIADVYHDMAKKDGVSLTESVHSAKELSSYTDDNVPLSETDLDVIRKRRPADLIKEELLANGNSGSQSNDFESQGSVTNHVAKDGSGSESLQVESVCSSDAQPSKLALKLGFTLPASSYATMAIRELLKMSTSVVHEGLYAPLSLVVDGKLGLGMPRGT